jgi:similar to spore coat protein
MSKILESMAHMAGMSDQVIATDFLISAKSALQNYAIAITEVTSPGLRSILKKQLNDAVDTHEQISKYMMEKGYYHAYDLSKQHNTVLKTTETALNLFCAKES